MATPGDLLICEESTCAATDERLEDGQTIRYEGYCYVVDRSKKYCYNLDTDCDPVPIGGTHHDIVTDVLAFECVPACGQAPCGPVSGWARGERCGPSQPGESGRTPYMCLSNLPACMVIPLSDFEQDDEDARTRCYKFSPDNVYFGDIGPDIWVVEFDKDNDSFCASCCQCNSYRDFAGRGRCYSYAERAGSIGEQCLYQPVWRRKAAYTDQDGDPCRNGLEPSQSVYVCCSEVGNVNRTAAKIESYRYVKTNNLSDGTFSSRYTATLKPGTNADAPIGVPYAALATVDILLEFADGSSQNDTGLIQAGIRCNGRPFVTLGIGFPRECDDPPQDVTTASFQWSKGGPNDWSWTVEYTRTQRTEQGIVTSIEYQRVSYRVQNKVVLAQCAGGCGKPPIGQGGGGGPSPPGGFPGTGGRLGLLP